MFSETEQRPNLTAVPLRRTPVPTFPFTFVYAGRTFSVVSDGKSANGIILVGHNQAVRRRVGATRASPAEGQAMVAVEAEDADVFVRIIGIRGLHEIGPVVPDESNDRLRERICHWFDTTYLQ